MKICKFQQVSIIFISNIQIIFFFYPNKHICSLEVIKIKEVLFHNVCSSCFCVWRSKNKILKITLFTFVIFAFLTYLCVLLYI